MKYLIFVAIALFGAVSAKDYDRPCRNSAVSPNVKRGFNVGAYMGTWFEISRYDEALWTLDCVTARYSVQADGSVQVLNSGYAPNGTFIDFIGRAVPSFPEQDPLPAKLDVVFFPGRRFLKIVLKISTMINILSN
jgi:lipocalin